MGYLNVSDVLLQLLRTACTFVPIGISYADGCMPWIGVSFG